MLATMAKSQALKMSRKQNIHALSTDRTVSISNTWTQTLNQPGPLTSRDHTPRVVGLRRLFNATDIQSPFPPPTIWIIDFPEAMMTAHIHRLPLYDQDLPS